MRSVFFTFLMALFFFVTSFQVSAQDQERQPIALGEEQTVTIVAQESDPEVATQLLSFVPETDGTYRFLISYDTAAIEKEDVFTDVVSYQITDGVLEYLDGTYLSLDNGAEFEGKAGISYELCLQCYDTKGESASFTCWVEQVPATEEPIPPTGDADLLPLTATVLLSTLTLTVFLRKKSAA